MLFSSVPFCLENFGLWLPTALLPVHLLNKVVVFGDDVVPVLHAIIELFDVFVTLSREFLERLIVFLYAVIGLGQFGFEAGDRLFVFSNLIGQSLAGCLKRVDFALLKVNHFFVGSRRKLKLGDARAKFGYLVIHSLDGIGVSLDRGGFFINRLAQIVDLVSLYALL